MFGQKKAQQNNGYPDLTGKDAIGVLSDFEPLINLVDQDGSTIVSFDSNFRYDLDREAKAEMLGMNLKEKGNAISFKVDDVQITEVAPNGMQFATANVLMNLKQIINQESSESRYVLHTLSLALPAVSRNDDGSFNHLSLIDIRMALADKIVDAASFALDNYLGGDKALQAQHGTTASQERAAHLNIWSNNEQKSVAASKPTLWSLFQTWPLFKKIGAGVLALFVGWMFIVFVSGFFKPSFPSAMVEADVLNQLQNSPEATNAQVQLTRETLKQMGLDPANVQSDLGCLAH